MDEISKIGEKADGLKPQLAAAVTLSEPPTKEAAPPKEAAAAKEPPKVEEPKDDVKLSPEALKSQELNQ
jgi:hypothetical protein